MFFSFVFLKKKISMFIVREPKIIPYLDQSDSLWDTIKRGGRSRKISPLQYGFKRIRNYFLFIFAYVMPFNRFRIILNRWKGINIGKNVYIGLFCFLDNAYPEFIYLEDGCALNAGSMVISHFNLKQHFERIMVAEARPVIIKKGAMVAVRSIILPGVTIGENAMIGAASVVSKDVEPCSLVMGNPAKKITSYRL